MGDVLLRTVDLLFQALFLLILARVILSWLPQYRYSQIGEIIFTLTDPILRPIQRLMPSTGMLDFSPMVAIITLIILQFIVDAIITSFF